MSANTAKKYSVESAEYIEVEQSGESFTAPLIINEHVADHVVVLPAALDISKLPAAFMPCKIAPAVAPTQDKRV